MLKPDPLIEAEFTVTVPVPDDVSVNDCVAEEFTVTLPKLSELVLTVNSGVDLFAALAKLPDVMQQTASRSSPSRLPGIAGICREYDVF